MHRSKAGLPRLDENGRKLDFHSLRYTFATKLARQGVSQRLAQELMRHSDPRLTANIYTDAAHLPTFEAIEKLDWHQDAEAERCPQIGAQKLGAEGQNLSRDGKPEAQKSLSEVIGIEKLSPALSLSVANAKMVAGAGFEPAAFRL